MHSVTKTLAFCGVMMLGFAAPIFAGDAPQDVVEGPGKQPITSTKFGNCVQTKWSVPSDPCAAAPAPQPRVVEAPPPPAPQPALQLEHEALTIYFDFNKAIITSESKAKLDTIADAVNRSSKVTKVDIVGYTDEIGSDSYNNKLSQKRADAVNAYLATRTHIPTGVLGLRGLGKADPVATGCDGKKMKRKAKIACMAKDRRVEIEFELEK